MNNQSDNHILEAKAIIKNFPGVKALNNVDFLLKPGEIRGLVGKNGAGKSTLVNILTGIYPKDGGQIIFDGEEVETMSSTVARRLGITCVHQHSQLIGPLSIAENVFCGDMPVNKFGVIDWKKVNQLAETNLRELGLNIDVTRKVEGLSIAESQILEIAKAMFAKAKVIILDEATAPLPKNEVNMLFDFVRKQRDIGVAFIYISHYLEEVFELCDSVTILRDGEKIGDYGIKELDQPELIRLISGVAVKRFKHTDRRIDGEVVLEVSGLSRADEYSNIDLVLKKGEVVGLTGLEGCGKDTLARGLFGLENLGVGSVKIDGKDFKAKNPGESLDQGLAYLPRDRHGYGIIGLRSISENITLPILHELINKLGLTDHPKENRLVDKMVEKLNIKASSVNQQVQFLSGGNQQKTVFAKLVSINPKVLLLDEPTQGVDVQAKVEIMRIVEQLALEGVAIVIISEEIRELLDICDRIIVMYKGKIIKEFITHDKTTSVATILQVVEGSN